MNDKVQLHNWDAIEYLRNEEDIAMFIEAALEQAPEDAALIASVLSNVSKARVGLRC